MVTRTRKRGLYDKDQKTLRDFLELRGVNSVDGAGGTGQDEKLLPPYLGDKDFRVEQGSKSFHIVSYGCQMNVSDSEIVRSVLTGVGYEETNAENEANSTSFHAIDVVIVFPLFPCTLRCVWASPRHHNPTRRFSVQSHVAEDRHYGPCTVSTHVPVGVIAYLKHGLLCTCNQITLCVIPLEYLEKRPFIVF